MKKKLLGEKAMKKMFILMLVNIATGLSAMDVGGNDFLLYLLHHAPEANMQDTTSAVLIGAAQNGRKDQCELLLATGANVNAQNDYGNTPLQYAAMNGHKEICKLLIANKANINTQDSHGFTALMYATNGNYKEICELLIENKAAINTKNQEGLTALMLAANNGHKEICELLIANGADIYTRDKHDYTPLIAAVGHQHMEIGKLLINAMLKLTNQERSEALTLLSLKKRIVPGLHSESKKLITQRHLDDIKRAKKQRAYEEIMKLPVGYFEADKKELLQYLGSII
jgi:ankyrin repeat protein